MDIKKLKYEAQNKAFNIADVRRCSFQWYSTEDLIDCLPENRPLCKDSGLWQIRTDDMENVYFEQNCNETLRGFILRYLDWLEEFDKEEVDSVWLNLSTG